MSEGTRLILVSGLSGSGKSVALHALEDLGYYCIDNMPAALLQALIEEVSRFDDRTTSRVPCRGSHPPARRRWYATCR